MFVCTGCNNFQSLRAVLLADDRLPRRLLTIPSSLCLMIRLFDRVTVGRRAGELEDSWQKARMKLAHEEFLSSNL